MNHENSPGAACGLARATGIGIERPLLAEGRYYAAP